MVVIGGSLLASRCSHLDRKPSYPGEIHLEPRPASPRSGAVWNDGSIKADGGAAAVQQAPQTLFLRAVKRPQSSAQCEWVALTLVVIFHPAPSSS